MVFFSNSLAQVVHHPAGYVRLDWSHALQADSEEFREAFGQALTLCRQAGLHTLYTNVTHMPLASPDDCGWLLERWLPQAVQAANPLHFVLVVDEQFGQFLRKVAQVRPSALYCFTSSVLALEWLACLEAGAENSPPPPGTAPDG